MAKVPYPIFMVSVCVAWSYEVDTDEGGSIHAPDPDSNLFTSAAVGAGTSPGAPAELAVAPVIVLTDRALTSDVPSPVIVPSCTTSLEGTSDAVMYPLSFFRSLILLGIISSYPSYFSTRSSVIPLWIAAHSLGVNGLVFTMYWNDQSVPVYQYLVTPPFPCALSSALTMA